MYPTSEAYKTAIAQNVRDVKITGTITLKDGITVINISDADIVQGSLYFTEQCVSGEDIEIGNVYASELGLALTSPPENPYALDGARIVLNFGIETSEDVWEYVPLGYFYVTEIERKTNAVALKALDGMILFDTDLSGVLTTGTPYEMISSCCTKVGITLATDSATFATFANGNMIFTLPAESNVKTCRDLIMWICQLTGTFARMNRMGQLEIVPVKLGASVKTIDKQQRFTSDVSDSYVKITKVTMKVSDTEYSQGTDGMTMVLEENPFLVGKEAGEINTILNNILNQVTQAEYIPYNVSFAGDPALQAGDYVTLTGIKVFDKVSGIFTRSSVAYLSDGTQVAANQPRFEQGRFGKAIMVEEGTTNLIKNASFETGTADGWTLSGTNMTVQSTEKRSGSYALRIVDTSTSASEYAYQIVSATAGTVYTLSAYAKMVSGTQDLYLDFLDSTGARIAVYHISFSETTWTRKSITQTAPADTASIKVWLYSGVSNTSDGYWDDIQLEAKAYPTSIIFANDATTQPTRSPETLTIPTAGVLNPQEGTVECWVKPLFNNTTNYQVIFLCTLNGNRSARTSRLTVWKSSANSVRFQLRDDNSDGIDVTVPNFLTNEVWTHLAVVYSTGLLKVFKNGSLVGQYTASMNPLNITSQHIICVGNSISNSSTDAFNGLIDDLRISNRALTDEEIAAAYASGQPLPVDEGTTLKLSFDDTLSGITTAGDSIITHSTWRYRGPHNIKAVGKSALVRGVQAQQNKSVSAVKTVAEAAREIAQAANQSTQLINDAIGGHVLIRREPGGTNEILIMDNEDPDQARKIWRWNMGGLGYSDNVIGVDNPARQYEVAMTMDGAINANFIKTGKVAAQYITVGPETVFADGYDPTAIQIGGRNLIIRHNEVPDTMIGEDGVSAPLVGSSMVNDFIPVQPGDTLTFSQIIQDGTGDDYFRCAFYTDPLDNASYVVRRISNNATVFTETVPEGAYWLRVSYATKNQVQLERGTRATDWTPAPEDVEAYAEHKATEAQAAAEAVARAEAELAETQAKAYADGIVDAEEQARIDDANAKLAEAKAYAETKSGEAQTAAQAYAEQKAAEAQAAAEAVARAEATLAQVNAEAYADGKVSAEEQARIDQAAANLAEAKTHAEAKAAEAEQAAKAHSDAQLSDHDANQSPHSLPAYVRMEPTGFVVYDEQGVKRTHNGMYAPGEYGNWVDAGHYVLRDKGMDMSLMQLPNLIPDHSFECLKTTGNIDTTYHDFAIAATSGNWFEWNKVGSPRLLSARQTGIISEAVFGLQAVVTNSSNYVAIRVRCKPNTTYYLSGFVARGYRNSSAGTPRLYISFRKDDDTQISTTSQTFTPNTELFNWKRVGFSFTTPANCALLYIVPYSTDNNYVYWDALQLVEGNKPVRYEPEENLWRHMFGASGVSLQGHIVESGENANGRWIRFSDGTQVCWYYGSKSIAINNAYGSLYQGTYSFAFPASFSAPPAASIGLTRHSQGVSWGSVNQVTTSTIYLTYMDAFTRASANMPVSYIAIGRWK